MLCYERQGLETNTALPIAQLITFKYYRPNRNQVEMIYKSGPFAQNLFLLLIQSMYSLKYYKFLKKHTFLDSKVSVCDLVFELKTSSFSQSELLAIAVYVFKKAPKYSKIIFQSLVNEILPNRIFEADEQIQIEEQINSGLVSLYVAKGSKKLLQQCQLFREKTFQAYNICFDRKFSINSKKILLRAYIQFHQGQLSQALQLAKFSIESLSSQQGFIVWANHLLIAQIHYARKNLEKCIQALKLCLKMNNDLPIKARVAMAHCYFHLGKFQIAQLCFRRILKLDQHCVQAVMGLAIICQRNQEYQLYFYYLKIAAKMDKKHPLVLLHLAEHFLIVKDLSKARQYSQRGLEVLKQMPRIYQSKQIVRDDYFEFQGRFLNIIGQTHHIKEKFQKALKYYNQITKKELFCSIWNKVQIAQCMAALRDFKGALYVMQAYYHQFAENFIKYYKDTKIISDTYRLMSYLKNKLKQQKSLKTTTEYYYLQCIKFEKMDPYVKLELSNYYLAQKDYHNAQAQFQKALQLMSGQSIQIAPEIYNNYGAIYLQKKEPQAADIVFKLALSCLYNQTHFHIADKTALESIILINTGIVAQMEQQYNTALQIYRTILGKSKFYTDAYLRMAYCMWKLGNKDQCFVILAQALKIKDDCEKPYKIMHPDRINILKAYIQLEEREFHSCALSLKLIQEKDAYTQLLELCLMYQQINLVNSPSFKIQNFTLIAQSLDSLIEENHQNPYTIFGSLIINLLLQELNASTKKQLLKQYQIYDAFSQLKNGFEKRYIAPVIYNTALYSLKLNQLNSALPLFKQIKTAHDTQTNSLIAYCQLQGKQVKSAIKTTKLNLLLAPSSLKIRYQLSFLTLKRPKEQFPISQVSQKMKDQLKARAQEARHCCRLVEFLDKNILVTQNKQGKNNRFQKTFKKYSALLLQDAKNYNSKYQTYVNPITKQVKVFEQKQNKYEQAANLPTSKNQKSKQIALQPRELPMSKLKQQKQTNANQTKQVKLATLNKQFLNLKRQNIVVDERSSRKIFKRNAISERKEDDWLIKTKKESNRCVTLSEQRNTRLLLDCSKELFKNTNYGSNK